MKRFAALFAALDATTRTSARVAALTAYFRQAPEDDRLWCIALLSGRRPKRSVTATELRLWAAEAAGLPPWLFEEAYPVVGDLAETIALVLPPPARDAPGSLTGRIDQLIALTGRPAEVRRAAVLAAWDEMATAERFLFNKLITGGFRMGVSRGLMVRALSAATGLAETDLAHRLMGDWSPRTTTFSALTAPDGAPRAAAQPYPFALAHALDGAPEALGPAADWLAEWKWDGIRAQIVARPGTFAVWSRGEELITDRFPDLAPLADHLPPGTVLDGELLAWDAGRDRPLPFFALQTRIGRKTLTRAALARAPVRLLAYDLLEDAGRDLRAEPLALRRDRLQALVAALPWGLPLGLSPALGAPDWDALTETRATARDLGAEGLMLKRRTAPYHAGRKRGDWWKWKLAPHTVDAVLVYAQAGHGRRATLYTDYTFALRRGEDLVPVAKAYSGLTDAEFAEITRWVRAHTLERFGPVRRVVPELVFEIAFEGVQESPRHKAGLALRFPRMVRWRRDKDVAGIDTLDSLRALLSATPGALPPDPRGI